MPHFRQTDILIELVELCREQMTQVRQQLTYYRASVYKTEMAATINGDIGQLQLVGKLLADDALLESFSDYEAMAKDQQFVPGECSFSRRVSLLLGSIDSHLARLGRELPSRPLAGDEDAFAEAVRSRRGELLALCRFGSRQWAFFEAL